MATIDLSGTAGTGHPAIFTRTVPYVVKVDIDIAKAVTSKGSALAAADVIEALDIPAGSVVVGAGAKVVTAVSGGATVLTVDVRVGATVFADEFNLVGATAGTYAASTAAAAVAGSADTVDVVISTLTGTLSGGVLRIWALVTDLDNGSVNPGLVALGS